MSAKRRLARVSGSSKRYPLPTWLGVVWLTFFLFFGSVAWLTFRTSAASAPHTHDLTAVDCHDLARGNSDLPAGILARVILDAHPTTNSDEIRLGDIACVVGDDELVARLESVSVGASPLIGTTREMSIPTMRLRIRQAGINDRLVEFVGPNTFSVQRETAFVRAEHIMDVLKEALLAALPPDTDIAVQIDDLTDVPVPPGDHAVEVVRLPSRLSGPGSITINILVDGVVCRSIVLRADIRITQTVWVASEYIGRHEPLGPHNMEPRSMVVNGLSQPAVFDHEIAWRANRVIQAGSLIEQRFVEPIPDALSGQRVTITFENGAIQVQAAGTLLADALLDAVVSVRNEESGRIVSGRLVTPERVVVSLP